MRTCIATGAMAWAVAVWAPSAIAQQSDIAQQSATAQQSVFPLQITFEDGSQLHAALADDVIPVQTQYGMLVIPSPEVRRIEFAVRPSEKEAAQFAAAIDKLGRDPQAKAVLVRAGERALPALAAAARADRLAHMDEIRDVIAAMGAAHPGAIVLRDRDAIETSQGTIRGSIALPALKIRTSQFGLLTLYPADARTIGPPGTVSPRAPQIRRIKQEAQGNPGNLSAFAGRIGERFLFQVTGSTNGTVWGTDTYTSDSDLATAAVHAGAVAVNETDVVEVRIVAPIDAYRGSARHGVATHDFGPYSGAYQVRKAVPKPTFRLFRWWTLH